MAYVFGINLPVMEILFLAMLLFIIGIIFVIIQMKNLKSHIKVLESTTLEIKRAEEEEMQKIKRFEMDISKLESEEAELFITKVIPTISKLENYVVSQMLEGVPAEKIKDDIVKRGIKEQLANKVINSVVFYLDFYSKLPKTYAAKQVSVANSIQKEMEKSASVEEEKKEEKK